MSSTFLPNRILERHSCQNRHTGLKLSSKRENSALSMKIGQNDLFRSCAARFGQIAFVSVKVLNIVTLACNSLQNGKTVRFPWKIVQNALLRPVRLFWELWRSQIWFWPNQICERQSSQNSHTGLKFSPKRKKGALFTKIVQNALFRSCAARFGEIKLVSVKLLKIVTLVPNSFQNGKTVRFSWKL